MDDKDFSGLDHRARVVYSAEFQRGPHTVKLIKGPTIRTFEFPYRGWCRHDRVEIDGKVLQGFIQVRCRPARKSLQRIEATTCHDSRCVMGASYTWLAGCNGIDLPA